MMKLKKLNDEFSKDLSIMNKSTMSKNRSEVFEDGSRNDVSKIKSTEIIPIRGVKGKTNFERMRNRVVFKKFIGKEQSLQKKRERIIDRVVRDMKPVIDERQLNTM